MQRRAVIGNDLTEGPVTKQLLRFAMPFMLSNGLQALYSMVDMVIVGNYVGSGGLSAVNIASNLIMLITTLCMGFSMSGQVYIAQLVGNGRRDRLNATIGTMFTTIMALALIMTLVGLAFRGGLLRLMNTPPEAWDGAMDYMRICSGGIVFIYGYNMVSATLRGMGDSKHPLLFIFIASVINIVLDIWFVWGWNMGVAGAAYATVIGQAVSFLWALCFLYRRRDAFGFDFRLSSFRVDRAVLKLLTKLGVPFALQMSAINISMLFVNALINAYGGVFASAAFGVSCKVQQIPDIMSRSIGMATSGMAGQNLGAKKFDRAVRTVHVALMMTTGIWLVFGAIYLLWPEGIFRIFNNEAPVLALAGICAFTAVISYPAHAVMSPCNSFVQVVGDAKFSLIVAILDGFVARISLSYLFGVVLGMDLFGFFLGYNLATYVTGIPSGVYFFSGCWKKRKMLVDETPPSAA